MGGEGGTPGAPHHPDLAWGVPWVPPNHPDLAGVPPPRDRVPPTIQTWLGYLHHPDLTRVPPSHHPDLVRVPPHPRNGVPPPSRPGWGTPHHPDLDVVPPDLEWSTPPTNVNRQTPVKTVSSSRTTYAGGKNLLQQMTYYF